MQVRCKPRTAALIYGRLYGNGEINREQYQRFMKKLAEYVKKQLKVENNGVIFPQRKVAIVIKVWGNPEYPPDCNP